MLIVIWVVFIAVGILALIKASKNSSEGWSALAGAIIGLVICFTIGITIIYFVNRDTYTRLKAFSEANEQNFIITVTKTEALLSEDTPSNRMISGSIEKTEQGKAISERIAEYRDAVNTYNSDLSSLKFYKNDIFVGVIIPGEVENLKTIVIK